MSKRSKHQKAEFPAGYPSGVAERLTPPPKSAQSTTYEFECMDDDHEPGCRCGKGRTDSTTYTYHTNEQDNGNAVRYAMGLPPYSPLTQEELSPSREGVAALQAIRRYDEHERSLLVRRISNQRRELRNLNRAYRSHAAAQQQSITRLRDQLKLSRKVTEQRNQQIENLQRDNDELRRQLNIAQNGGRRKRGVRWVGK